MPQMRSLSKAAQTLVLAVFGLAGCAVAPLSVGDPRGLAEPGQGLLILHTSLNEGCAEVTAALGTPTISGRAIDLGRTVTLKRGPGAAPALIPPGSYGIVRVTCRTSEGERVFAAPVLERGSVLDGSGAVYAAPLATFRIGPGEVLDGGSLRIAPTRPGLEPGRFAVAVAPSPEPWLRDLAASDPNLLAGRVVRPVTPR